MRKGLPVPCSGSDGISCAPPQRLAAVLVHGGDVGFLVLDSYRFGILSARLSRFRPALLLRMETRRMVDLEAHVVIRHPCICVRVLGSATHSDALDLSDAENRVATRPWPPMPSERAFYAACERRPRGSLIGSPRGS